MIKRLLQLIHLDLVGHISIPSWIDPVILLYSQTSLAESLGYIFSNTNMKLSLSFWNSNKE
jgi:hypothetical protein